MAIWQRKLRYVILERMNNWFLLAFQGILVFDGAVLDLFCWVRNEVMLTTNELRWLELFGDFRRTVGSCTANCFQRIACFRKAKARQL
ncbi:hypothetical protein K469DRAFT_629266, partial [Zopfia rhizophila CBS 207.26]